MSIELPFDTTFYNILYTDVSYILKTEYPQQQDEPILEWYKRLLHEFMTYLQSQYEPSTIDTKVKPDKKTNQKKDTPTKTYVLEEPTLFSGNVEKALEVVSQDSNFAIYLFAQWLPLLLKPTDWFSICLLVDCDGTPANSVILKKIEIKIENYLSKITIESINGIKLSKIKELEYERMEHAPYMSAIFKTITKFAKGTTFSDIDTLRSSYVTSFSIADYTNNSYKIARLLCGLKNITTSLFISELTIKSNLISENNGELKLNKGQAEKSQRKKFNARKLLKAEDVTPDEMSSGILQTLSVQAFRTFFDFDKDTIDQDLFDYMFYDKPLVL